MPPSPLHPVTGPLSALKAGHQSTVRTLHSSCQLEVTRAASNSLRGTQDKPQKLEELESEKATNTTLGPKRTWYTSQKGPNHHHLPQLNSKLLLYSLRCRFPVGHTPN